MAGRTKIYVGNISDSCKAEDLRVLFAKYGAVEECDVVKNFGFVHMSDEDESKVAIDALNGSEFMGVKITVEASHSKVRPKAGMGGKGQCYRCGKSGHWSKECPRNSYERNGPPSHYDNYGRGPPISGPPPMPYGPDRGYNGPDRGYGNYGPMRGGYPPMDRGYDRAPPYGRPYPDPYDRRPPPPLREDGYYSRRPYDDYYSRRSPPPPPPPHRADRYSEWNGDRRLAYPGHLSYNRD